jgi:hypothetical protein
MDWMNQISDIVQKYGGQGGGTASAPADPHEDFQKVAQTAPREQVAQGLSQAFQSDQTPPFPEMLANLFGQSDPNQRAGLLNRLLGSINPAALASLPGLGGLMGMLSGNNVGPEQANQVSPVQVKQIAEHAQQQNPSIVDEVSRFYADHPQVVRAIGASAVGLALHHILQRR